MRRMLSCLPYAKWRRLTFQSFDCCFVSALGHNSVLGNLCAIQCVGVGVTTVKMMRSEGLLMQGRERE